MAKNESRRYENKKILNFIGFVVTILVAIAILITVIYSSIKTGRFTLQIPGFGFSSVHTAIMCVANVLAYFVCMVTGFLYAKSKRNVAFVIIDIICIVLVVATIVISMFGVL